MLKRGKYTAHSKVLILIINQLYLLFCFETPAIKKDLIKKLYEQIWLKLRMHVVHTIIST